MKDIMKCGHTANATCDGKPCCVICSCFEIDNDRPCLDNRIAKCSECGHETQSNYNLPFFQYRKDKDSDEYYCGCHGWD